MIRRICISCFAVAFGLGSLIMESENADAQGLLRRIQSRIQSRVQGLPPYGLPQNPLPQDRQRQTLPARPSLTPSSRVQPKRVSPVSADSVKPRVAPPVISASGEPATDQSSPAESNQYGESILSRSTQPRQKGSIGIDVYNLNKGELGVAVARIQPHSKADEAGLKKGDVIVAVDGRRTSTIADISSQLSSRDSGDTIKIRVLRDQKPLSFSIPLVNQAVTAAKPPQTTSPVRTPSALADSPVRAPSALAGSPVRAPSTLADSPVRAPSALAGSPVRTPSAAADRKSVKKVDFGVATKDAPRLRGSIVTSVDPNTPAAAAGIKVGDRIVSVNGRLLRDARSLQRELAGHQAGEELSMQFVRGESLLVADVRLIAPDPTTAQTKQNSRNGSMIEGFGSMLGGLLGGEKSNPKRDEMAFGDDEPIDQVGFEAELNAPAQTKGKGKPKSRLETDPPSLQTLELPLGDATPIETQTPGPRPAGPGNAKLLDEIRRLEERLKELEAEKKSR